jgi:HD-GYP domain-containing protein (c-di-GMP phosphodiesterase class II)
MPEKTDPLRRRSREEMIRLNRLGKGWLKALYAALRTIQIHDSRNQIFDEPIGQMLAHGNELIDSEGHIEVQMVEDQFFLNRLWVKPTLTERDTLYGLVDVFKRSGIGAVTLRARTSDDHLRKFFTVLHEAHAPAAERAAQINRALAEQQIEELEVAAATLGRPSDTRRLPISPVAYSSVVAYAKVLLALKDFVRSAPGEEQVTALRKAQRIICELIDISEHHPRLVGLLATLRDFDADFVHHCVNVFLLSLLFGRQVGIGRRELVDLGMASLFFDVGKLALPDELLNKVGTLTDDEWRAIRRHPVESAVTFLNLGYMNESVAERVLVAFQHHRISRTTGGYPETRREMAPSLMSDIVGICDRYDASVTDKVYRTGLTPRQAIRVMASEGSRGVYRPDLLDAFLRFLGPVPVGSWVVLDGKKEGVVACSGTLSPAPPLPVIYVPPAAATDETGEWIVPDSPQAFKGIEIEPRRADPLAVRRAIGLLLRHTEGSPIS